MEREVVKKVGLSHLLQKAGAIQGSVTDIRTIKTGYYYNSLVTQTSDKKSFFLKETNTRRSGSPERIIRDIESRVTSHEMTNRSGMSPRSFGVMIVNPNGDTFYIPELSKLTEIYHIQEYEPEGTSLMTILIKRRKRRRMSRKDLAEIVQIVEPAARTHSIRHTTQSSRRLRKIYNECLFEGVLARVMIRQQDFDDDYALLPLETRELIITSCFRLASKMRSRIKRVRALHGDFWGSNIFFRKKDGTVYFVDFGGYPWGDPGTDIGWFIGELLWLYHETGNPYYKEYGEAFLNLYEQVTGDFDIREMMCITFGLKALIKLSPRFFKSIKRKVARKFLAVVLEILITGKFCWDPSK